MSNVTYHSTIYLEKNPNYVDVMRGQRRKAFSAKKESMLFKVMQETSAKSRAKGTKQALTSGYSKRLTNSKHSKIRELNENNNSTCYDLPLTVGEEECSVDAYQCCE